MRLSLGCTRVQFLPKYIAWTWFASLQQAVLIYHCSVLENLANGSGRGVKRAGIALVRKLRAACDGAQWSDPGRAGRCTREDGLRPIACPVPGCPTCCTTLPAILRLAGVAAHRQTYRPQGREGPCQCREGVCCGGFRSCSSTAIGPLRLLEPISAASFPGTLVESTNFRREKLVDDLKLV